MFVDRARLGLNPRNDLVCRVGAFEPGELVAERQPPEKTHVKHEENRWALYDSCEGSQRSGASRFVMNNRFFLVETIEEQPLANRCCLVTH